MTRPIKYDREEVFKKFMELRNTSMVATALGMEAGQVRHSLRGWYLSYHLSDPNKMYKIYSEYFVGEDYHPTPERYIMWLLKHATTYYRMNQKKFFSYLTDLQKTVPGFNLKDSKYSEIYEKYIYSVEREYQQGWGEAILSR